MLPVSTPLLLHSQRLCVCTASVSDIDISRKCLLLLLDFDVTVIGYSLNMRLLPKLMLMVLCCPVIHCMTILDLSCFLEKLELSCYHVLCTHAAIMVGFVNVSLQSNSTDTHNVPC